MSDDDRWLRELAQVNREEDTEDRSRLDERWDRLSGGELSPEEEAEMRALAETSEEAREAYEAFRPLGPDFQASVVQAIQEQARPSVPAKLLTFPSRTHIAGWSTAMAAAAALLVVFARPPAPLPNYQMEISGVSPLRGEENGTAEVPIFVPGGLCKLGLRPETAASPRIGELEARCFLARDQELRTLEVRSQFDPGGAVKMEGTLPSDLQPGGWTLWAVVGRRGKLPDAADLRSATKAPVRRRDWAAVPQDILIQRIQPRGP
jgi:hypothetical protein